MLANTKWLTHSHRLERSEILEIGVHQVGELVQAGSTLGTSKFLPWSFERSCSSFDCCIDVAFTRGLYLVTD